jgi:hypothetical protein
MAKGNFKRRKISYATQPVREVSGNDNIKQLAQSPVKFEIAQPTKETAMAKSSGKKPFPFLQLPRELRDMVYENVEYPVSMTYRTPDPDEDEAIATAAEFEEPYCSYSVCIPSATPQKDCLSLLLINKQFSTEFRDTMSKNVLRNLIEIHLPNAAVTRSLEKCSHIDWANLRECDVRVYFKDEQFAQSGGTAEEILTQIKTHVYKSVHLRNLSIKFIHQNPYERPHYPRGHWWESMEFPLDELSSMLPELTYFKYERAGNSRFTVSGRVFAQKMVYWTRTTVDDEEVQEKMSAELGIWGEYVRKHSSAMKIGNGAWTEDWYD